MGQVAILSGPERRRQWDDEERLRIRGDMADLADIDRLYDAVQQKHAQIDVVFANAGGGELDPLGAITEEHYEKTFGSNVKGVLFTAQKALPLLRDTGRIAWSSGRAGEEAAYAGWDVVIVRDGKIAALYVFLDETSGEFRRSSVPGEAPGAE
jgi:NAD(P)-dependent dehydrogenase (short-subunit alcohol dehydrogenase family)